MNVASCVVALRALVTPERIAREEGVLLQLPAAFDSERLQRRTIDRRNALRTYDDTAIIGHARRQTWKTVPSW